MASFDERLQGLLANPTFNLGVGLLGAGGPSAGNESTGQRLGQAVQFASGRQQQIAQNDFMRNQIAGQQQIQDARSQLGGLFADDPVMGALSVLAPDAAAHGLLQPRRGAPADVQIAQILADPNIDPALKTELRALTQDPNADLMAMMARLELDRETSRAEIDKIEAQERAEARRIQTAQAKKAVLSTNERLIEAAQLNQRLAGTLTETGSLGIDVRADLAAGLPQIGALFNMDPDEVRSQGAALQRLEQLTNQQALGDLMSPLIDFGTLTTDKTNLWFEGKPGVGNLPETNNLIFADMLEENLRQADLVGETIPDREFTENFIKELRSVTDFDPTASGESSSRRETFEDGTAVEYFP